MSTPASEFSAYLKVQLSIDALGFAVVVGFADLPSYDLARKLVFGRLSGARLPPLTYELVQSATPPVLCVDLKPRPDGRLDVQFRGEVESPAYVAEMEGFHWDFSKVLNALVMTRLLGTGLVPIHGACVATPAGATLLLGGSGAGKSSTAYAALASGKQVYASELGFVRGDMLECANSALTIDRAAIHRFGLPDHLVQDAGSAPKLLVELPRRTPVTISRVCFVQVNDGPARSRRITDRRARMLLFENVVTQLPVTQLLSQETWPIWLPPRKSDIDVAMETVQTLSALSARIVEGHPAQIVGLLCEGASSY